MNADDADVLSQGTIATARLRRDEGYFNLVYDEWFEHRSKYRRIALPVSLALLTAGGLSVGIFGLRITTCMAVCVGLFDLLEVATHRLRSTVAMKESILNRDLIVRFSKRFIEVEASGQVEQFPYAIYDKIRPTPRGFFLVTGARSSTFVPFETLSPLGVQDQLMAMLVARIR